MGNFVPQLCWEVFIITGYCIWSKAFFCFCSNNHMLCIFWFANVVYHINWFANIDLSLHPWEKSYSIMLYDPFNILLNLDYQYFVEHFCMCVHQWPCLIVFVFGISCLEGKILVSEAVLVLEAVPHWTSSDSFWNGLRIVGINSSWKCLVEFTYEAIWSWTFVCWEIFSLTFKNAFNKLFLEIYRHFFYNLSYNEISIFQICCFIFVQLWPLGALTIGFCVLLTSSNFFFFFLAFLYFLVLQDAQGVSCIFHDTQS